MVNHHRSTKQVVVNSKSSHSWTNNELTDLTMYIISQKKEENKNKKERQKHISRRLDLFFVSQIRLKSHLRLHGPAQVISQVTQGRHQKAGQDATGHGGHGEAKPKREVL